MRQPPTCWCWLGTLPNFLGYLYIRQAIDQLEEPSTLNRIRNKFGKVDLPSLFHHEIHIHSHGTCCLCPWKDSGHQRLRCGRRLCQRRHRRWQRYCCVSNHHWWISLLLGRLIRSCNCSRSNVSISHSPFRSITNWPKQFRFHRYWRHHYWYWMCSLGHCFSVPGCH